MTMDIPRKPTRRRLPLGQAAIATFSSSLIGTALRFGVQVLLVSFLGAAGYGAFVVARSWGELLSKLPDRGYALGSVRFIPRYRAGGQWGRYRGLLEQTLRGTLKRSLALAAVTVAAAAVLQQDSARLVGIALLVAISMAVLLRAALQGSHAYLPATALVELGQPSLMLVGFLMLRQLGHLTVLSAIITVVVTWLVVAVLELLLLRSNTPVEVRMAEPEYETETWNASTRWLYVAQIGIATIGIADIIIVGAVVGEIGAGVYAIATRIAAIGRMANAAVESLVSPQIAAAVDEVTVDRTTIQGIIDRAIRISIGPSVAFAVLAAAASGPVLDFFGKDFSQGRAVLLILVIGNLADAVSGPSGHVVSLVGSERGYARIMIVNAFGLVILGIPAAMAFGIVGVAAVRTGINITWNIALFAVARRQFGLWCLPRINNRPAIEPTG